MFSIDFIDYVNFTYILHVKVQVFLLFYNHCTFLGEYVKPRVIEYKDVVP